MFLVSGMCLSFLVKQFCRHFGRPHALFIYDMLQLEVDLLEWVFYIHDKVLYAMIDHIDNDFTRLSTV